MSTNPSTFRDFIISRSYESSNACLTFNILAEYVFNLKRQKLFNFEKVYDIICCILTLKQYEIEMFMNGPYSNDTAMIIIFNDFSEISNIDIKPLVKLIIIHRMRILVNSIQQSNESAYDNALILVQKFIIYENKGEHSTTTLIKMSMSAEQLSLIRNVLQDNILTLPAFYNDNDYSILNEIDKYYLFTMNQT